jgi:uncharacterized membrane protein YesL
MIIYYQEGAIMDYFGIVKKAFILPWKYRFLFWLGVLATFASGGGGGSSFNFSGGSANFQDLFNKNQDKSTSFLNSVKGTAPWVLGESTNKFQDWLSSHWYWIALIILILLVIFIVLWVFGMFARGGLIRSVASLEKGKKDKATFKEALWEGKRYFWRFVGAGVLLFLVVLLLVAVLGGIAVPFFIINMILGLIWLVPAILIFIVVTIYLSLLTQFWSRLFVVEDKGIIETIKPTVKLVNTHFKEVIIFWLVALVISFIYFFAAGLVVFVLMLPFILVAVGVGIANLVAGIVIGVIGLLITGVAMLAVSGYYSAALSGFWTLAYLEIGGLKKAPQGNK